MQTKFSTKCESIVFKGSFRLYNAAVNRFKFSNDAKHLRRVGTVIKKANNDVHVVRLIFRNQKGDIPELKKQCYIFSIGFAC